MILLLMDNPKAHSCLMSHYNANVIPVSSSHHIGMLSHIFTRRSVSTIQYFERAHIHINCIILNCYNCSISSLVIVVNLTVPHLYYKLNFIIGMYVQEKTHSVYSV